MAYGSVTDAQVHEWLKDIAESGWISLHFDTPALGGELHNELDGGGYQRFKMIWSPPTNRAIWSMVDARFTGLLATKITFFGVWNMKGTGTVDNPARLMAYAELPEPVVVLNGKGYVLHQGDVAISFG